MDMDTILTVQLSTLLKVKHISLLHQVCPLFTETVLQEGRRLKGIFL